MYLKLNAQETEKLDSVAGSLGVAGDALYHLINFESSWDPSALNDATGARGLIQFMPDTARSLGFADAEDLYANNPDRLSQLDLVYKYLRSYTPFPTDQSLAMAVFYPAYRNVSGDTLFPQIVRDYNPGINTPNDYLKKMYGPGWIPPAVIMAGLLITIFLLFRKGV